MSVPKYHPNYSLERRSHALNVLRNSPLEGLSTDAQITYAVSLLICDDNGRFTHEQVAAACADLSVVTAARALLAKVAV